MIEGEWQLQGDGITGWARDSVRSRELWLELIAHDTMVGICCANLPEPENCGFWFPVAPALLEEDQGLQVRVVNNDLIIPRKQSADLVSPKKGLTGDLYVDRGLSVSGWVLDPDQADHKLELSAWIGTECIAQTVAAERRYRPPMADGHGFSLSLPIAYADGQSHIVNIRDEYGREIPGSPFRIRSLDKHAGEWLKRQKKVDKPALDIICGLLENMEERLPGFISQANYTQWKKAFPVPNPPVRPKFSIASSAPNLLKNQQACEARIKNSDADFVLLPGNAELLHPLALSQMVNALKERNAGVIYSDGEASTGKPLFKPAWDKLAYLSNDYLGPILATKAAISRAGIAASDSEAVARFKLMLGTPGKDILHLPLLLYQDGVKIAASSRIDTISGYIADYLPGCAYDNGRLHCNLSNKPRISILIPTKDHGDLLQKCLVSLESTSWPDYEIIIIDNGTTEALALSVLQNASEKAHICVLSRPGVFNYAELNNDAARLATGELLCFLNNDTEALHPQWLDELAAVLLMAGDQGGAVGAKLVWPNGLVQHAGVIIGTHQLAAHVGNNWLEDEPGYMNRNQFAQQYSAVTAACLLTHRKLFLQSGGFDGRRFPIAFNDVDYCLRLRSQGKKIFWTPHSLLAHHESASRGKDTNQYAKARADREMNMFRTAWGHYQDPFYNPNLPLSAATEPFHGLAFPPGPRQPR